MAKGEYKALTYLMVGDEKVAPGDTVTRADLEAAGQTAENIDQLLESGAISDDMQADVLEEHREIERTSANDGLGDTRHVITSEEGKGE